MSFEKFGYVVIDGILPGRFVPDPNDLPKHYLGVAIDGGDKGDVIRLQLSGTFLVQQIADDGSVEIVQESVDHVLGMRSAEVKNELHG